MPDNTSISDPVERREAAVRRRAALVGVTHDADGMPLEYAAAPQRVERRPGHSPLETRAAGDGLGVGLGVGYLGLPTFESVLGEHGDPEEVAGSQIGAQAARIAAKQHRAAAHSLAERAGGTDRLLASEARDHQRHITQAQQLAALGDAYSAREIRAAQAYAATGQTGPGYETRGAGGSQYQPRAYAGTDEPYRRGGGYSYFADLVAQRVNWSPDVQERLQRHATFMDQAIRSGEVEKRTRKYSEPLEQRADVEYRANPSRLDGSGGFFVPPLYVIDEYVTFARAGRATADLFRPVPLPPGTDSINLPKVTQGTATGIQPVDGAPVTSQDFQDGLVTGAVRTISGQQDFSLQLMEQSPINMDQVFFQDLTADYNKQLDTQVINGSGTAGQLTGLLNVSGINAVTYTDASPTLPEMWVPIQQAASKVANGVFMPPTAVVTSASEWYWMASQLDTTNRPLLGGLGPQNAYGSVQRAAENKMGELGTWPAIGDANIPVNLGGGSNETRVILAAWDELWLFESSPRIRVLQEVLSGTMQVRVQLYNYVTTIPDRRPKAISVISGTGCIVQSGF